MVIRKKRRGIASVAADASSSNVTARSAELGRHLGGDILSTIDNSQHTPPRQERTNTSLIGDVMNMDDQPATPQSVPLTPPLTPSNHFEEWLTGNN